MIHMHILADAEKAGCVVAVCHFSGTVRSRASEVRLRRASCRNSARQQQSRLARSAPITRHAVTPRHRRAACLFVRASDVCSRSTNRVVITGCPSWRFTGRPLPPIIRRLVVVLSRRRYADRNCPSVGSKSNNRPGVGDN